MSNVSDIHGVDDCAGVTCQNGGTCLDEYNAYTCLCSYEYTGAHCETRVCDVVTCLNFGTCNPRTTVWFCDCVAGFSGTYCGTGRLFLSCSFGFVY